MASPPDGIVLKRHRDLEGLRGFVWVRRGLLAALALVPALGLVNAFGQRPETLRAEGGGAALELYAPSRVRGGLLFEARFTIRAEEGDIDEATLVLDEGWLEGLTINTIEPAPVGEASRDGRLALELGHVPAGRSVQLFMQFQVNPTNVGHRSQGVELDDGETPLLQLDRSIAVYP
jgi:hypothetical protein